MSLQRYNFPLAQYGDEGGDFECWAYIIENNDIYCKLKEFVLLLGYTNVKKAYKLIPADWKCSWSKLVPHFRLEPTLETPSNWHPGTIFVSEPGIYALLARSTKPQAKKFMYFVYENVLPAIRKRGQLDGFREYLSAARIDLADVTSTDGAGYVYLATNVIFEKSRFFKIGSTCDLDARMKALNTASPENWRVLFAFETQRSRLDLELKLQRALRLHHFNREFFKFKDRESAVQVVKNKIKNLIS